MMIKGIVVKNISGQAVVETDGKAFTCSIRKTVKMKDPRSEQINERLMIGDNVLVDTENLSIEKILPRRNELKRPHISNIDCLLIFLSPLPEPDFFLVDKIIMQADALNIENYIIINKSDEASTAFISDVKAQYTGVTNGIFVISALENKIDNKLKTIMKNKLTALAGQSGVGKSTFLNAIMGKQIAETGIMSVKIERGKNTTRHSEIFTSGDIRMVDTPGFSLLDNKGISPQEFKNLYTDISKISKNCVYTSCNHINQPEKICAVVEAVNNNTLNKKRYDRYVKQYDEIKKEWNNRYGN